MKDNNESIRTIGEFNLIESIKEHFPVPAGVTGIGDDCAVLPQKSGRETLVTTDMLMEGVHFLMEDADPYDLGWKSAAVNISDIAAMGGVPVGTFLSFALPKTLTGAWVERFIEGYKAVSDLSGTPLLGGDTTSSLDRLCINVTVLGECQAGASRKRSAAVPGDLICTTGYLGDSAGGLQVILDEAAGRKEARTDDEKELVRRHYQPVPRVSEGVVLAGTEGVHAMMDISDGVGSDLRHILKASGVSAVIDVSSIPVSDELKRSAESRGWNVSELALNGGEDYELLFTISPEAERNLAVRHFVIGRITEGLNPGGVTWEGTDKEFKGFHHF